MAIRGGGGGGGGGSNEFADNVFRVTGSGDATKKLAFEVDGISPATTRTITVPDFDGTVALFRSNKLRIGDTAVPTAVLHLIAGTATAGTAPIKLTSGVSTTVAVAGQIEMTTDNLFFTITTGNARKRLLMADPVGGLTSGLIPFATTNGRLTTDADLAFSVDTLTVTKAIVPTSIKVGAAGAATIPLEVVGEAYVSTFLTVGATASTLSAALEITGDTAISGGLSIGSIAPPTSALQVQSGTAYQTVVDINGFNTVFDTGYTGILASVSDIFSGIASGDWFGLDLRFNVGSQWTAGTSIGIMSGFRFLNSSQFNDVVNATLSAAMIVDNDVHMQPGAVGSVVTEHTVLYGLSYTAGSAITVPLLTGVHMRVGYDATIITTMAGFVVEGVGSMTGTSTTAVAYDIIDTFGADAGVTTWYGLRIPSITGPGTIWGIYQSGTMDSAIAGNLRIGSVTAPTVALDVTGSIKSSALTSGRVVFSTTGGQLTDDADMTFATDTLTVTKIAATTLTGLLTIADAIDISVNGTTGTKIGTATSQKLGLWNAAPIVQPTNAIAAAAFVANTSGIANDTATFDGYTLGQVVKALRNIGLLA